VPPVPLPVAAWSPCYWAHWRCAWWAPIAPFGAAGAKLGKLGSLGYKTSQNGDIIGVCRGYIIT